MINGTEVAVLSLFTANITETFTLREAARRLNMHVSQAHRAIKTLISKKLLKIDKHKHLALNYADNHEILSYVEYIKRNEFLKNNSDLNMFAQDIIDKIKEESFMLILFGSAVRNKKPRDIDVLVIVDKADKIEPNERFLSNIASNYDLPIEAHVIPFESVYEMLAKRDEKNVMNETLNKHIILYGAELFYRLIKRSRK